jgi:hypothetical protein
MPFKLLCKTTKTVRIYIIEGLQRIGLAKTKEARADLQQAVKLGFIYTKHLINGHCK